MKRVIAATIRSGIVVRLTVLSFLICLITSCLQIDYYITINKDGSETLTEQVAAIKEIKLDKMEVQLKALGFSTSSEIRNDSVHLTATKTLPAGKWAFPYPIDAVKDSVQLTQSYNDYFFFKKYGVNARYTINNASFKNYLSTDTTTKSYSDLDKGDNNSADLLARAMKETSTPHNNMSSGLFVIPIRYHIHVPGSIDTTTSLQVVANTMNWTYRLETGENVNVAFSSTEYNYTYIIVFALVVIALGFYFVFRKKKLGT